jgi:hypothetical protein
MKYLALGHDGLIHDLGDCDDFEDANMKAEGLDSSYFYLTNIEDWKEIAEDIIEYIEAIL